ncbi:MAG: hypothetical protein K2P99_05740 [Burkholderiales bacterium]|nr:hypothetical protein [Burkholderiales bacterium]
MSAFTLNNFDVFEYVKRSKELGVPEDVAEYQARQIEHVIEIAIDKVKNEVEHKNVNLVTKGDIKEVELKLQKEIDMVRKEIAVLRYDTLKFVIWTGVGVSVVVLGGIFALLKTMIH